MKIYNTHAHSFRLDHVPDRFYSLLSIRFLKSGILNWLMIRLDRFGHLFKNTVLIRLARMLAIINKDRQEDIFNEMQNYYPGDSRFVILSMDMEHMGAGKPAVSFLEQLDELADLKNKYREKVYPFVCADPRNPDVTAMVKHYVTERGFAGIKLYPALGYYPFDIRLHDVYRFALKQNLPVISHCSKGPVYYRGKYTDEMLIHPVTGKSFTERSNARLSWHFTDPRNFDYLMDEDLLNIYMHHASPGMEVPDFSKLKVSMGHFGGDIEIRNYLEKPWNFRTNNPLEDNDNWFSTTRDLINKYDHFYADISYTWEDPSFNSLLKVILEESREGEDKKLFERILFGTDYFLVTREIGERQFAINLRAFLGERNFRQIATLNPVSFLGTGH
jgi:uncharacterized protein